jgi:aspartyl-tRNA(Asn)/glutamyl-tRNA(Gln) amidotransferase subunit A
VLGTARALSAGRITGAELTARALARVHNPAGEGSRTYIRLFADHARAAAAAWDGIRQAGAPVPVLAGIPVSVKDLCDVAGSVTTAGSLALKDGEPAEQDAPIVFRLRSAGAVIVGTTNMTEFAMGGLGLNPHYGTPRNPYDRAAGRIPGGSSSGAAVSITDAMAVAAIGTDTAGSVRMPAALCGIAGFKPTARRVPVDGTVPLAPSLDSIGALGATVACCMVLDGVLAQEPCDPTFSIPVSGLRFAVPKALVLDDLDPAVATAFSRATERLSGAGARIVEIPFAELAELPKINAQGGFPVAEGYAWHRALLEKKAALYDPVIAQRLANGARIGAADYIDLLNARRRLVDAAHRVTRDFDAVLMPTVPIVAPRIADFDDNEALWLTTNRLLIRNPGVANFLDRCALSIPCHEPGAAPVGLTLMGEAMADYRILAIGRSVEALLAT